MKRIPLPNGQAHFQFTAELDGEVVNIRADWLTRFEYFIVTVEVPDQGVKVSGRGLHPNIDLLKGLRLMHLQSLYIRGDPPTPSNLDQTSQLVYGSL